MDAFCWMVTAIGFYHFFTSMMGGSVRSLRRCARYIIGILGCPWYLGSMDYFTPIVGCIRPANRRVIKELAKYS